MDGVLCRPLQSSSAEDLRLEFTETITDDVIDSALQQLAAAEALEEAAQDVQFTATEVPSTLSSLTRAELAQKLAMPGIEYAGREVVQAFVSHEGLMAALEERLGAEACPTKLALCFLQVFEDKSLVSKVKDDDPCKHHDLVFSMVCMAWDVGDNRLFHAMSAVMQHRLRDWMHQGDGVFHVKLCEASATFLPKDEHIKLPCTVHIPEQLKVKLEPSSSSLSFVEGTPYIRGELRGKEQELAKVTGMAVRDADDGSGDHWITLQGKLSVGWLLRTLLSAMGIEFKPAFSPKHLWRLFGANS